MSALSLAVIVIGADQVVVGGVADCECGVTIPPWGFVYVQCVCVCVSVCVCVCVCVRARVCVGWRGGEQCECSVTSNVLVFVVGDMGELWPFLMASVASLLQ